MTLCPDRKTTNFERKLPKANCVTSLTTVDDYYIESLFLVTIEQTKLLSTFSKSYYVQNFFKQNITFTFENSVNIMNSDVNVNEQLNTTFKEKQKHRTINTENKNLLSGASALSLEIIQMNRTCEEKQLNQCNSEQNNKKIKDLKNIPGQLAPLLSNMKALCSVAKLTN